MTDQTTVIFDPTTDPNPPTRSFERINFRLPLNQPNGTPVRLRPEIKLEDGTVIPAHVQYPIRTKRRVFNEQQSEFRTLMVNVHIHLSVRPTAEECKAYAEALREAEYFEAQRIELKATEYYDNARQIVQNYYDRVTKDGCVTTTVHVHHKECHWGEMPFLNIVEADAGTEANLQFKVVDTNAGVHKNYVVLGEGKGLAFTPIPVMHTHTCSECSNDFQNRCPADKLKGKPTCPTCFRSRTTYQGDSTEVRTEIPLSMFRRS